MGVLQITFYFFYLLEGIKMLLIRDVKEEGKTDVKLKGHWASVTSSPLPK